MEVKKIILDYAIKNGFNSNMYDGTQHTKVLPYLSVVQAVKGNYDIQLGKSEVYNTADKGFFVAPSNVQQVILHHAEKSGENMICRWVFLKIKINDNYIFDDLYHLPIILPEPVKSQMNLVFDRLFASNDIFSEYICYYEIVKLLSLVAEKKECPLPVFLDHALTYIAENYQQKITIQDIAKTVNISEPYLFSAFKKRMGISPISYLNNYRLSIAAELLLNTTKNITEIAAYVGIGDSIYFNKLFKKYYQMSPTQYRKSHFRG